MRITDLEHKLLETIMYRGGIEEIESGGTKEGEPGTLYLVDNTGKTFELTIKEA